jgi:hypothetical protein
VVPPFGSECFEPLNFCLDVVCFQVDVHSLLRCFRVGGVLQEHAHIGVRELQLSVHMPQVGGAAYAGGDGETASVVRLVTEDASVRTVTQDDGAGGSTAGWDCPEKGGAGQGESGAPTTPEQPAAPQESL